MTDNKLIAKRIDALIDELQALKSLLVHPVPESPPEAIALAEEGRCLLCHRPLNEMKTRPSRGCHAHCYKQVMGQIRTGEITEADAIASGILLVEKTGGRPPSVNVSARIAAARVRGYTAEEAKVELERQIAEERKAKKGDK